MGTTTRSPNYPQISLPEAIERIRRIYQAEHTHRAGDEVLAKNLGYNSLNGTSRSILSALKKYGLLQPDGDGFRVSDDAVDIIELPLDDPAHSSAVQRAAFKPALFAELFETFGTALPSDSNLRHYLIKKKFHPGTAAEVIRIYRDTLVFVAKDGPIGEITEDENGLSLFPVDLGLVRRSAHLTSGQHPVPALRNLPASPSPSVRDIMTPAASLSANGRSANGAAPVANLSGSDVLQYRVSRQCKAHVVFDGPVTQEAVRKLIAHLELSLDDFPDTEPSEI